jgi:hypothetical protein
LTQVSESFSEGQGVGISVSKPCVGHTPRLNVGVAVASGDGEDHPTAKSTELLVLSAVVPWAFSELIRRRAKLGSFWHMPWVHPS